MFHFLYLVFIKSQCVALPRLWFCINTAKVPQKYLSRHLRNRYFLLNEHAFIFDVFCMWMSEINCDKWQKTALMCPKLLNSKFLFRHCTQLVSVHFSIYLKFTNVYLIAMESVFAFSIYVEPVDICNDWNRCVYNILHPLLLCLISFALWFPHFFSVVFTAIAVVGVLNLVW